MPESPALSYLVTELTHNVLGQTQLLLPHRWPLTAVVFFVLNVGGRQRDKIQRWKLSLRLVISFFTPLRWSRLSGRITSCVSGHSENIQVVSYSGRMQTFNYRFLV